MADLSLILYAENILEQVDYFTDLNREPSLSIAVKSHELTARVFDLAISSRLRSGDGIIFTIDLNH
jgi:hypothetical protein